MLKSHMLYAYNTYQLQLDERNIHRGSLYKRFPGLTRKSLLPEERKKLVEMGHSQHVGASSISLLKVRTKSHSLDCLK